MARQSRRYTAIHKTRNFTTARLGTIKNIRSYRSASGGTIGLSPSNPCGTRPKHADATNHLQSTITSEKSCGSEHAFGSFTKTSRGGYEGTSNHCAHNPTIHRSRA